MSVCVCVVGVCNINTNALACVFILIHTSTYIMYSIIHTSLHTHTQNSTYTYMHTPILTHTFIYIAHTYKRKHARANARTHTRKQAGTYARTRIPLEYTQINTPTRAHKI